MLKIVLKEPVTSAHIKESVVPAAMHYLLVQGSLDKGLSERFATEKSLTFIEPGGSGVLVPVSNIAYMQEQSKEKPENAAG